MKIRLPAFLRVFGRSVVDWYDAWLDMTMMGIVWLIAQATIVLGPAATFGVYYVMNLMVRTGENPGLKGMISGARLFFLKSLAWGALNWLVWIIVAVNVIFYTSVESWFGLVARYVIFAIGFFWLVTQFYAVPFFMAQEKEQIFLSLKNGFFMAMATLFYTLGLSIIVVIIVAASVILIIPAFLGVPMLVAMLGTRALYDRFEAFGMRKKDPDPKEVR